MRDPKIAKPIADGLSPGLDAAEKIAITKLHATSFAFKLVLTDNNIVLYSESTVVFLTKLYVRAAQIEASCNGNTGSTSRAGGGHAGTGVR